MLGHSKVASAHVMSARLRASGLHALISVFLAAIVAIVVFGFWYPSPYRSISGGQELFWLLISVDVVIGPLLTLVVFNLQKPRRELARDLGVIGVLQLAALAYGTWTLFLARPVHLVFEVDRFRVVSAVDVDRSQLRAAPPELQRLPLTGPTVIAARQPRDDEMLQSLDQSLQGSELAMRPGFWQAYDSSRASALAHAKPLPEFSKNRAPDMQRLLREAAASTGLDADNLKALPVVSRFASWTVLIDSQARPVAFAAVDPF